MALLLAWELHRTPRLEELWQVFLCRMGQASFGWWITALLLMPLNWFGEVLKWQPFVARYEPFSKKKACCAVLAGIGVSLLTPNRVGEFGGRILLVSPEHRWRAVAVNAAGNVAQLLVILSFGFMAALHLCTSYAGMPMQADDLMRLGGGVVLTGLWLVYFNMPGLTRFLDHHVLLRRFRPLREMAEVSRGLSSGDLARIALWSAARYAVYSTQYWCLVRFFGIEAVLTDAYAAIGFIFLVQSGIPLPPVAGLLARGNLAIWVWSLFGANPLSSLAASFALWCLNLIFPALAGAFVIMRQRTEARRQPEEAAAGTSCEAGISR